MTMSMSQTLGSLSGGELEVRLARGLRVHMGPFVVAFRGTAPQLIEALGRHYPDYPLAADDEFSDVGLEVGRDARRFRSRPRDGLITLRDGAKFVDFPLDAVLAYLEWSINWGIATHAHQYLMLHAAVIEHPAGGAVIFPGLPGSGKSTLCAYLIHRGWRLLSDEFTLLPGPDLALQPFPRLIPLKNESIEVIRSAIPEVKIGPSFPGTRKGTVAHVCPPSSQIHAMDRTARPRLVIFPSFKREAEARLSPMEKSECFVELTKNSFNYNLVGRKGFELVADLVDATRAYRCDYGRLAEAETLIDEAFRSAVDGG